MGTLISKSSGLCHFEYNACRKHVYRQFRDCFRHRCIAPREEGNAVVGSVVTSVAIAIGFLLFGIGNGSCLWTLIIALALITAS